jgi:hypothetical protein
MVQAANTGSTVVANAWLLQLPVVFTASAGTMLSTRRSVAAGQAG